jgi:SAM-dependent methyltransferase
LYLRARRSLAYAARKNCPGIEFAEFGQTLARRLIASGAFGIGLSYLLTPVNIVRYFEFPFVLSCLPQYPGECLDVSSPRLFSLFVAAKCGPTLIFAINPDSRDIAETARASYCLGLRNVSLSASRLHASRFIPQYDCVWSISAVEHIAGDAADTEAVKAMYSCLKPGGRLILTVPVDRCFWLEFRDVDPYGTQGDVHDGKYFFQRWYDHATLLERLIYPLGRCATTMRWFGERRPGLFVAHEQRWIAEGLCGTVEDAREIADNYAEFDEWNAMPGKGVCGFMIEKPDSGGPL